MESCLVTARVGILTSMLFFIKVLFPIPYLYIDLACKQMSFPPRNGWKSCLFPARVVISIFDVILLDSTFPYLTWRVNNYVSRQEKV